MPKIDRGNYLHCLCEGEHHKPQYHQLTPLMATILTDQQHSAQYLGLKVQKIIKVKIMDL